MGLSFREKHVIHCLSLDFNLERKFHFLLATKFHFLLAANVLLKQTKVGSPIL